MDVDYVAGAYPDGTQVAVLEKRQDGLYAMPRYKVQVGRAIGWVFEDEMLTDDMWLETKKRIQHAPFQNHWLADSAFRSIPIASNGWWNTPHYKIIGTLAEPSFIALGIYQWKLHAQFSDMDGFLSLRKCYDVDGMMFFMHEPLIWITAMQNAVVRTKGADEANWTDIERAILEPPDPNYLPPHLRRIHPARCDIDLLEAQEIAFRRLKDFGHIADDNITLACNYYDIYYDFYYDYFEPSKHIWEIHFSDADSGLADGEMPNSYIFFIDAHSKEIFDFSDF